MQEAIFEKPVPFGEEEAEIGTVLTEIEIAEIDLGKAGKVVAVSDQLRA